MARQGWGRHSTVATGSDSGDQVSVNAWNADINKAGMLGFTAQTATITISTGNLAITDSVCVAAAETGTTDTINTISITDTSEYDLLYLFADTGDEIELENTSNPSVDGQIRTISNANETLSSTTPTILIRKGNYWYGYGGGVVNSLTDIGDVTITSASAEQGLIYNGSSWVNEFPSLTGQYAKNSTGSTISKGKLVYISGYDIGSGYPEISLADNTSSSTMAAIGVVREDILNNATGFVIINGKLSDVDTSTFSVNAIVYVGTSGDFTTTKPTGTALIQNVGKVLRSHASNGQIEIISIGRTNDVPNIPNGTIWVGNASAVPTPVTPSGDVTITNTGVTAIGSGVIVNDDINASAAIDATKIANGLVSSTEFQYLDGVTSAIQTQIDSKQATLTFGIANTNAVKIDSADAASGEYAKLTASGIESKSFTEVKTDLSLNNVENTAISTFAGSTNITTLGTVATGTWNSTAISEVYGGTNQTTYATGDILYASGANTLAKLTAGTDGYVLTLASGVPTWAAGGGGATIVHTYSNTTNTAYTGTASSFGTVGVGDRDIYIKKIDANNEGVFTKIWKNGSAVEVQIA